MSGDDYKADSQFQEHMKEKSEAASHFARSKTIKQQRQYLPIYAVRHELVTVIRDNQVRCRPMRVLMGRVFVCLYACASLCLSVCLSVCI